MTEYTDFVSERNRGTATVCVCKKDIITEQDKVEINWNCCGSVSVEDAKAFRNALNRAIKFAESNARNQGQLPRKGTDE